MANYAIRVELRGNPTWELYDQLHALMAGQGFLQTIRGVGSKGQPRTDSLPHAVYFGPSDAATGAVRDWVVAAVQARVQKDILVFVVQASDWAMGW
jgi:hypothetical protein